MEKLKRIVLMLAVVAFIAFGALIILIIAATDSFRATLSLANNLQVYPMDSTYFWLKLFTASIATIFQNLFCF